MADAPRADDPTPVPTPPSPPPEGTVKESFLQRSATVIAILGTYAVVKHVAHPHLVAWIGETGAVLAEEAGLLWLAAFGISRQSEGLRRA